MSRKIRDPIHGFIEVNDRECDLLDTPPLQRLRRVHQLAMASLVYPGALHTRFDHSLGVLHVASKLCEALRVGDKESRIVRFAALLHDVGHGPFSHVSESVLDALAPENLAGRAGKKETIHELVTHRMILEHRDFAKRLRSQERQEVAALLRVGFGDSIHKDIISGPLDADKQDYLLRDSYFCGVQYGVYDLGQLHNTLCREKDGDDAILVVAEKGLHALEQYVLAKYYLTTQVYRHKGRLITDTMLVRALRLGVEVDKIKFLDKLYRYKDTQDYIRNYLEWDDQRVTVALLDPKHEKTHAGRLFRRLQQRRLFKRVFQKHLNELPDLLKTIIPERLGDPATCAALEREIAEFLSQRTGASINPHHVILHYFKIKSVRAESRNSEAPIMIRRGGRPVPFEDHSTLFKSINAELNEEYVECYAPVAYDDQKKKERLLHAAHDCVMKLFQKQSNICLPTGGGKKEGPGA